MPCGITDATDRNDATFRPYESEIQESVEEVLERPPFHNRRIIGGWYGITIITLNSIGIVDNICGVPRGVETIEKAMIRRYLPVTMAVFGRREQRLRNE